MLYPKHYVELSLIRHMKDHRRKDEIDNIAEYMLKDNVEYSENLSLLNIFPNNLTQVFESLQHHEKSSNKHKILELSKIFGPYQDKDGCNVIPNMIIIEGAPGMGKTTLCKEIAYRWANNQMLVDTEFVLFIRLRNPAVKQMKDLKDLIRHFYKINIDLLEQYLDLNSNKIAIIFDGYDEFSDSCGDSVITEILNRIMLPECKIIITSRHTASYKLLNQNRKDMYVRVEILGFSTKESRMQYIEQELDTVPSRIDKLKSYLDTHASIEKMCYIPMMMTILVYIFKEKEELPADSTNLYETLIACAICRFYQKIETVKRFTSLKDMPKECKLYLRSLSNFAFLALEKYQIVFTEEDIEPLWPRSPLTKADLDSLGLVKITQYFSIERSDERTFNFLNLSIQEYLAAYFVNSIDQIRQFETLKDTFFSSQYSHMWKMFITISKQKWFTFKHYSLYFNGIDSKIINKRINNYGKMTFVNVFIELIKFVCQDKKNIQLFCFKVNEDAKNVFLDLYSKQQKLYLSISCGDDSVNSSLFEIFLFGDKIHEEWHRIVDAFLNTHNYAVTVVNTLGLVSCKANQNQLISSLRVNNSLSYFILHSCHITGNAVKSLEDYCAKSEYLRDVVIDNCYFDNKNGLREIINALSNKSSLVTIQLFNITIMEESIEALASTIRSDINLQALQLCNIKFHGRIEKVINAIENKTTLKEISITNNNLSTNVSDRLATALQSNDSLIRLNLADNNLKASAIIILQCVSMIISQLHLLNLEGNYMPKEAGEALESVILNNPDLEILILKNNNLGDGALKVARALKSLTSLKTLDLGNNNLPGNIMNELSRIFISNKCLKRLSLCNNNLKSSILCVLKSLSSVSKLEYLDIQGNQITAEAGELLSSVIQKNTVINTLLLGNNNIGKGMMQIAKALQQITSLKVLDLGKSNIHKETCNELALAIDSNRHLENLSLQDNALCSSVTTVLQRLSKLSSLETLDLQGNQLNENTAELLASVISNNNVLKSLNLCNNSIGKGALQIAKALRHITSLRLLNLGDNMLIKEVCNELAYAIKCNINIESLYLHDNKLQSFALVILQSLSTITTLRVLNMNNNQIGEKGGDALASVIKSNTGLKELYFSGNNLQRSVIKISKALQTISTIESLDLSNNNLTNEVGIELAAAIQSNSFLKQLHLQNNNLQSSIGFISQALDKLSTLKSLVLNNNQLTEKHGESLRSVIKNNASLETLFLGNNNIGLGAMKIVEALQNIKSLKMLDFSNINLPKELTHQLATAIKSSNYLELLAFTSNNLQASAIIILQSLSHITTLKVIHMNDNQIGEKGGEELASVIKSNTRLIELQFGSNHLQKSAIHISEALQTISYLESLDLSNNNLPEGIGRKLAAAIRSNNSLRQLMLHSNNLQSSIVVILQALSEISTLELLDLHDCHLTSIAAKGLESVIVNNTGLKCLYLNDNKLGKDLIIIYKALQNISSLKKLNITNNNFMNDLNAYLTVVNKFRAFVENLCQCTGYSDSSGILKQLCTSSNSNTNVSLTEQAERALTSVLQNNPRLEGLHIDNGCINLAPNHVIKALSYVNYIKVLSLNNLGMSREMVNELAPAIKFYSSLENIYLHGNKLKLSLIILSEALSSISTLKVLDLQNNEITEEAGDSLASVVLNNPSLEALILDNNNIGVGALKIAEALQNIKSLKVLDLNNNNLPKEIAHNLAAVIKSNCNLERLTLSSNNLQSSAIVILQSLSTITTLKILNMDNNQIGEKGGKALASVIKSNTGLKELHFGSNNLHNSIIIILEALQTISSLESLDLSNNNLPEGIGIKLAAAIQSNNSLKQLWLHSNNLQSSIDVILQALSELSTLELLDLHNCHLTSIAAKGLESIIVNNTGLECLYLNDNNLGKGLIFIYKALQNNSSLTAFNITNNNFMNDLIAFLTVANKFRAFLENLCQCTGYSESSGILKTLCIASKSNTNVSLAEQAERALTSVLQNNPRLEGLHIDNGCINSAPNEVIKALNYVNYIKVLSLNNLDMSREMVNELASAIKLYTCLENIYLHSNDLKLSVIILSEALNTISTLKVLDLQNNELTEEAGESLASVIINNPSLEALFLDNNNIGVGALKIAEALRNIKSLKMLGLSNNNLSKEFADKLVAVIESNCYLELLTLSSNRLQSSATVILQSLANITTLKFLDMNNNQIGEKGGDALASVIKSNTRLQKLFFHSNKLQGSLLKISETLQNIVTLQSLDFRNNNLSDEMCITLGTVFQSNNCLEQLWFADNIGYNTSIIMFSALCTISTLKVLYLGDNKISQEAAKVLASVIMHNTGLEELCLSSNNMGEAALTVAKALQNITSLKVLALVNNNLPSKVGYELALVIESNKNLKQLFLNDNNLQSSINHILQSLSTISTLEMLSIDSNHIDISGCGDLVSVLRYNRLKTLNLINNFQKSITHISEALKYISALESLKLSCNNLRSKTTIVVLQALHPISKLKSLNVYGNTLSKDIGNILASVISKNFELQELTLNLLTAPQKLTKALCNLTTLQLLSFDNCNMTNEVEFNIATAISNNKSLTSLLLANIKLSQNVVLSAITLISNLTILYLEDNLLTEEMSDDLSLAISSNKSLELLILLDNMLQTGLIKIAEACNKLSNIKVLQLAHNCIVPSKVVELTSVITQNTSLEGVLLGGITLNAAECFHLNINEVLCITNITSDTSCVIFNHCTSLEVIYLEMLRKQIFNDKKCFTNLPIHCNAKNFVFIQKLQRYFKHSDITQLKAHVAKQKLLQVNAKKMISSLYILEKVKVIDLENNNIDEDASFELSTALHSNNVLEQLWLRGNKLNTAGALYILNSLEYLTTLQVLDLSYNNISSQSADGIAAVIDSNPLLNQLWLDGNDLHSTGTIKICKALKKIRTLSILSLCNNGITDDAAVELSAVITQNVLLEDLLLSNNQLHSTGIELIAESLNKLIKLRKLDLFNNNIGKDSASLLAVVMQNSTSLQDLFLSSNNLETSGALEICNALSHICSLHVLTLSNNNINDEVTSELIEVLNNNHLYALLIGGNDLECGGLKIAQVIENDNIAMQLLHLSDNNISEQDKEKIKVVFSKRANFQLYV